MKTLTILICCSILAMSIAVSAAPPKKSPTKPPVKNQTKGQGQIVGANGQFGTIYTLKNNINFQILSAKYTVDSYMAYTPIMPKAEEKLMVLNVAIKNVAATDNFVELNFFTLVDDKGTLYEGSSAGLESKGKQAADLNLRPGQGLGQPDLKDPLRVAFAVPASARIVKVMVNQGRLGRNEETIRYYVAGATKAEAGEAGDPKNVISPLPDTVRDTSHPSGALAIKEGKAKKGEYYPTGPAQLRLDKFETSAKAKFDGNTPEENKEFAIATITAKSSWDVEFNIFELVGDESNYELTTEEGDLIKAAGYRKAKSDAPPRKRLS